MPIEFAMMAYDDWQREQVCIFPHPAYIKTEKSFKTNVEWAFVTSEVF